MCKLVMNFIPKFCHLNTIESSERVQANHPITICCMSTSYAYTYTNQMQNMVWFRWCALQDFSANYIITKWFKYYNLIVQVNTF